MSVSSAIARFEKEFPIFERSFAVAGGRCFEVTLPRREVTIYLRAMRIFRDEEPVFISVDVKLFSLPPRRNEVLASITIRAAASYR